MSSILKIENLHVFYDNIHALKGISLEVQEGEIVSLIRANGARKTTTLQTISALIRSLCIFFMKNTKYGKAMLATSEDYGAAMLIGINVDLSIQLTFAIGSALAAIASVLYVSAYPQVQPLMGAMLGIKAFIAAVLGGIGILPGAVIGGFILGIIESLTRAYLSSQLADAFVFGILIVVLLVKPTGLLGKNIKEKV